jgi:hypothetical protein
MATHHTHTSTPHHTDAPHPTPSHHETPDPHPAEPRPAREPHATGGGHGGGYALHTDSLGTMEGHLGRTRDKVHAVGQTVSGANFGVRSMGLVGSGMTGTLNGTVSTAKEHVTRAGKAVEDAGARTKAVRDHYQRTEADAAGTMNAAGKHVDAPTQKTASGGSGPADPPPSSPPPPSGGDGGMHNNQGHHATDDELRGQYPRESMQTRPTSTDDQIRDTAARLGYDPDRHLAMTLQPVTDLTHAQRAEIVAVRNELQANPGELMTKVVKPEIGEATLANQTTVVDRHSGASRPNYPDSVAGSVARGSDSAQYGTPQEFRDKLALDDQGAGWTPIEAGANEAYQLRFPASRDPAAMEISYGGTDPGSVGDMQALSGQPKPRSMDPPFLGTGYTGGGVPEWMHAPSGYKGRGEMWLVHADGSESLAGVYLPDRGWFDVRGRGGASAGNP